MDGLTHRSGLTAALRALIAAEGLLPNHQQTAPVHLNTRAVRHRGPPHLTNNPSGPPHLTNNASGPTPRSTAPITRAVRHRGPRTSPITRAVRHRDPPHLTNNPSGPTPRSTAPRLDTFTTPVSLAHLLAIHCRHKWSATGRPRGHGPGKPDPGGHVGSPGHVTCHRTPDLPRGHPPEAASPDCTNSASVNGLRVRFSGAWLSANFTGAAVGSAARAGTLITG